MSARARPLPHACVAGLNPVQNCARLESPARGRRPTDHGFVQSIYFFDPSGHRLELTTRTCDDARLKDFEKEAPKLLALWSETHDWSRRSRA